MPNFELTMLVLNHYVLNNIQIYVSCVDKIDTKEYQALVFM